MTGLVNKISSNYIDAASRIKGSKFRTVRVYVEGYDDIPFWREVLDEFETDLLKFEISVPVRNDLAKGKKVVLKMVPETGSSLILCVDSDFDYIFGNHTDQSRLVNKLPYIFHTYVYSIENFICYADGLHAVCVHATKNDAQIFDFREFIRNYSSAIYPAFLWYALSARKKNENAFPLLDFKNTVKLNFLDISDDGIKTIEWLKRQVDRKIRGLEQHNPAWIEEIHQFGNELQKVYGVVPENCYLFMQGHTLKDHVILVALKSVCNKLKDMALNTITYSDREGKSLRNEMSNYTNSLRNVDDILMSHTGYLNCELYKRIKVDISNYVANIGKPIRSAMHPHPIPISKDI